MLWINSRVRLTTSLSKRHHYDRSVCLLAHVLLLRGDGEELCKCCSFCGRQHRSWQWQTTMFQYLHLSAFSCCCRQTFRRSCYRPFNINKREGGLMYTRVMFYGWRASGGQQPVSRRRQVKTIKCVSAGNGNNVHKLIISIPIGHQLQNTKLLAIHTVFLTCPALTEDYIWYAIHILLTRFIPHGW